MKFLPAQLLAFLRNRRSQRNVMALLRFLLLLAGVIVAYSLLFHYIMDWEGREYSWVTGFYWTLTVMSTLGFGDITFTSDVGRVYSIFVLLSGIVFLLVLLPFTFIQFFYGPWLEAHEAARAPRSAPHSLVGHVILTHYDSVAAAVIAKLQQQQQPYVLLAAEQAEALRLHDAGLNVVLGDLDQPETYEAVHVAQAALVATTASDAVNANVAATVREITATVPVIATADSAASVDILGLAGSSHVLHLPEMLGASLARRVIGGDAMAHVIGRFDQLLIAEANALRTPLVGKTLRENRLSELGVSVVGVWERGRFEPARPDTRISDNTVLVLAGSAEQLQNYDEHFCIYNVSGAPAVIIGGGRIGLSTARALAERGVDYRIVEQRADRVGRSDRYVVGNAAELEVLQAAGIMTAPTVVITTNDDNTNIYLTLYCRRLRPDIQIVSRATLERNLPTLHRAGADFVMSHTSMGANAVMNLLQRSATLMLAEGLDVFKVRVPEALAGRVLATTTIRRDTGCSVIAIHGPEGLQINPPATAVLPADREIVLIGTAASEAAFYRTYVAS
jgi:Trk K+ transport system NAD-binding subunit